MEARCRACCAARVCMRSLPYRRLEREIGGFVAFEGCITLAPPLLMTIQDKHINPMADNDGAPRGHRCVPEGGGVATGCVAEMDADAIPALDGGMASRVAARRASIREQVGGAPLEGIGGRRAYRFAKRAFDIIFSLLVLVCFCWLYALIAILVKADDPKGPVIFSQDRVGRDGRVFRMHKFRSMCVDAEDRLGELESLNEKSGPVFKIKDDPRVTRVGHWLRKLSLASVIIGTPGDGESTKSLSRSANSSLDLQLCECRPGLCSTCNSHYKPFEFLSLGIIGGVPSLSRNLVGCNAIRFSFLGFGKDGACAAW